MSRTRTIVDKLEKSFKSIGEYACYPLTWACGMEDKDNSSATVALSKNAPNESAAVMGAVTGAAFDFSIGVCKCCTRSPCCCIGTAITVPTGLAAASVLGVFGCVGVACAAASDIPEHCKNSTAPKAAPAVQTMK